MKKEDQIKTKQRSTHQLKPFHQLSKNTRSERKPGQRCKNMITRKFRKSLPTWMLKANLTIYSDYDNKEMIEIEQYFSNYHMSGKKG